MASQQGTPTGTGAAPGHNGNGAGNGAPFVQAIALRNLDPMAVAIVADIRTDAADSTRLKSLGICSGRRVQMVSRGDPLILRVLGTRIGLSAQLADGIYVEPCDGMGKRES